MDVVLFELETQSSATADGGTPARLAANDNQPFFRQPLRAVRLIDGVERQNFLSPR